MRCKSLGQAQAARPQLQLPASSQVSQEHGENALSSSTSSSAAAERLAPIHFVRSQVHGQQQRESRAQCLLAEPEDPLLADDVIEMAAQKKPETSSNERLARAQESASHRSTLIDKSICESSQKKRWLFFQQYEHNYGSNSSSGGSASRYSSLDSTLKLVQHSVVETKSPPPPTSTILGPFVKAVSTNLREEEDTVKELHPHASHSENNVANAERRLQFNNNEPQHHHQHHHHYCADSRKEHSNSNSLMYSSSNCDISTIVVEPSTSSESLEVAGANVRQPLIAPRQRVLNNQRLALSSSSSASNRRLATGVLSAAIVPRCEPLAPPISNQASSALDAQVPSCSGVSVTLANSATIDNKFSASKYSQSEAHVQSPAASNMGMIAGVSQRYDQQPSNSRLSKRASHNAAAATTAAVANNNGGALLAYRGSATNAGGIMRQPQRFAVGAVNNTNNNNNDDNNDNNNNNDGSIMNTVGVSTTTIHVMTTVVAENATTTTSAAAFVTAPHTTKAPLHFAHTSKASSSSITYSPSTSFSTGYGASALNAYGCRNDVDNCWTSETDEQQQQQNGQSLDLEDVLLLQQPILPPNAHFFCCFYKFHITAVAKVLSIIYALFYGLLCVLSYKSEYVAAFLIALMVCASVGVCTLYATFKWSKLCLIPFFLLQTMLVFYALVCVALLSYARVVGPQSYTFSEFQRHLGGVFHLSAKSWISLFLAGLIVLTLLFCYSALLLWYEYQFIAEIDRFLKSIQRSSSQVSRDDAQTLNGAGTTTNFNSKSAF